MMHTHSLGRALLDTIQNERRLLPVVFVQTFGSCTIASGALSLGKEPWFRARGQASHSPAE
jgi:hypothetical protein